LTLIILLLAVLRPVVVVIIVVVVEARADGVRQRHGSAPGKLGP
jgi:hypothetical protein